MSIPSRPYFYAHPRDGKSVHAYTKEEWGIGASSGGGRQYAIRSFDFSLAVTALFVPAALACAVLAVVAVFKFPAMVLAFLLFGPIFGLGVVQGYFNLKAEWRASAPLSRSSPGLCRRARRCPRRRLPCPLLGSSSTPS
ncbi:hypothetical protein [Arthrobacter sp. TB 26]|uniref:hypothetical protein n=1 Tax=Arthrobacter sp. TB 26 TaxID=494420 RepID=UPI000426C418|nr:hypothetical protein [Arthrobacter sp. TB 26]